MVYCSTLLFVFCVKFALYSLADFTRLYWLWHFVHDMVNLPVDILRDMVNLMITFTCRSKISLIRPRLHERLYLLYTWIEEDVHVNKPN